MSFSNLYVRKRAWLSQPHSYFTQKGYASKKNVDLTVYNASSLDCLDKLGNYTLAYGYDHRTA